MHVGKHILISCRLNACSLFDYFVVKIFEHHNDDARIAKIKVELVVPVWNQAKPSSGDLVIFRCQTNIGMVKAFGYVWSVVEKIKKQNRKFNAELGKLRVERN